MEYLHRYAVAHRDLKTENLLCGPPLIKTALGSSPTIKLSDFGTARSLPLEAQFGLYHEGTTVEVVDRVQKWVGTSQFITPELLESGVKAMEAKWKGQQVPGGKFKFTGKYDTKCDIYSLGVTFLFILTKELLYGKMNNPVDIYRSIVCGATPRKNLEFFVARYNIHPETTALILSMLEVDPLSRLSAKVLLSGAYFDKIRAHFSQ